MQEKLSVKKVYMNAFRYVVRNIKVFSFLTIFYFLGNLLPMFIGLNSFKAVILVYYYLFLYLAAGYYYQQQILFKRDIFIAAGLRFLTVSLVFLAAILISTLVINLILDFIRDVIPGGGVVVYFILHSLIWQISKYLFIFVLFIIFFIIPSFSFVSEISGKGRSILTTYVKTKGSIIRIAVVSVLSYLLLSVIIGICILFKVNYLVAELIRDIAIVFITIVYFRMYDFFYKIPQNKNLKKEETNKLSHAEQEAQTTTDKKAKKSMVKQSSLKSSKK